MQPMKLFNLLRRENVITLCTLRLASTTKSPTPRNLDNQTQKSIERVKDDKKSQAETVYKVPEYYEHKTFCFYDSEIQLKGFRLPQPNPS
ncbi:hypothetical protein MN116_006435 [Schistosoma mekongi]|uniref:Complex I-9kD n=1 Tax=Schistosoma mekongi TaxID=38744 RepID=A0AAE1ZBL5_SCHME|nr:hypothetical protein MN116_006435 [Schistosoma mekongi]